MTKKLPTNDEQLAALDEVYALFRLGEFYRDAQIDGYKAIKYFEKISDFKEIAEIYRYGQGGVEPDPRKAVEYFLKYEAAGRCPDDESDEFFISLADERRAAAFRNVAEIFFKLNDGNKALEYFLKSNFEWREFYFSRMINSNGRRFSTSPA